ncbi:hypothetical protein CPB84DRAFT_1852185 [Gymnopilus junonius]|uniref:Mucoidy inhibitor A n=1 Tax=Gymnopilus junonius TaxID=109634 RepID=A0A9P5NDV2_GYMJU|nr:hypothetical protein CPB84DRAFT_1852185 [Gymnopilus junonius]
MSSGLQTSGSINIVDLSASDNSKIDHVSVYPGRAEVTRQFEFEIKAGQNKINIIDFPPTLQQETLSVEGQENACIHDIVIKRVNFRSEGSASDVRPIDNLIRKKKQVQTAIERTQNSQKFLDSYLNSISTNGSDISRLKLETALDDYNALSEKLDLQLIDLRDELEEVRLQIAKNEDLSSRYSGRWQASANIDSQLDQKIKIQLRYVVFSVNWSASYDVRIDSQTQDTSFTILYKAAITQSTGEAGFIFSPKFSDLKLMSRQLKSCNNASITLETANPSLENSLELQPRHIFAEEGDPPQAKIPSRGRSWYRFRKSRTSDRSTPPIVAYQIPEQVESQAVRRPNSHGSIASSNRATSKSSRSSGRSGSRSLEFLSRSPSPARVRPLPPPEIPHHSDVKIIDKDDIFATFRVPGPVCIPCDGEQHHVSIAEIKVDGSLLRYGTPSIDKRVYLKADIRNDSDYVFVPGPARIFVDGSFLTIKRMPAVSSQEVSSFLLGSDHSIQLTYHPLEKTSNKSRLSRNASTICTQRITIHSTKLSAINNLKLMDNVPVSTDSSIRVQVLTPVLGDPTTTMSKSTRQVQVSPNVVACWDGADDPGVNQDAVGKNGKINWQISLQPQEKVLLSLQYEVTHS